MARRSGARRFFAVAFLLLILVSLGATSLWYLGPFHAPQEETFVDIEHGMSTRAIAALLTEQGLVRSNWAFLAARLLHPGSKLQAGEYKFGPEQSPFEIYDQIRRGQVFFEAVTVPEGSNMFDIAAIFDKTDTIKGDDFLKTAMDPQSMRDLDPRARTLEGYLFPSTYQVTHRTTAKQFCRMMTNEFRKEWKALAAGDTDPHRVVTLASLVEKETGITTERALVAGVFTNRLRVNMPLQCDPTTVYAALLDNRYRGVIHKSDLTSANPYNTYTHAGLPPGPIANPGVPSLKAALHPEPVNYLYFVARADGSGGHHFTATLAEHEKAVADFRKGSRQ